MYFENIQQEIQSKYKKRQGQKIAEKCLQLGEEWTRIVSGDLSDLSKFRVPAGIDPKEYKKELRAECHKYIKDNLDPSSFVPVWLFPFIFQIFLSAVINWIVKRIIERMFEKKDNE